jgi:(2Fe-2S) ferredoxin
MEPSVAGPAGSPPFVVVAGPASHDAGLLQEMEALAGRLATGLGGSGAAAWFDQGQPALTAVLEAAVAGGHRSLLVVPYFLQWSYPDQFSLPGLARAFAAAHPDVAVRLTPPVGLLPAVEATLAARARAALAGPPLDALDAGALDVLVPRGGMPRRAPARPVYPAASAHLLLCQGRWCLDAGGVELEGALREALAAAGRDRGPQRVQVTRTRCVGPCGGAPVVVHYPAGDWYWGLTAAQAGDLVAAVTGGPGGTPGPLAGQRFRPGDGGRR